MPSMLAGIRVVLMADPATESRAVDAANSVIAYVDAATERLIVEWPYVPDQPSAIENGSSLLVLIAQTGDLAAATAWRESLWVDLGIGWCG